VGATCPPLVDAPLTVTDFVRYQGASGDFNPIHHDAAFAARAGQPGPFAVGMRQAGVMANYAVAWLGPENLRRFRVQFREQAWPGDVLTYSGKITALEPSDDGSTVDVELECARDGGGVHLRGWATFEVPAGPPAV
jgi:acyl dehydratase